MIYGHSSKVCTAVAGEPVGSFKPAYFGANAMSDVEIWRDV